MIARRKTGEWLSDTGLIDRLWATAGTDGPHPTPGPIPSPRGGNDTPRRSPPAGAADHWSRRYGTSAMTVCSRPTIAALSRFAVWLYSSRSHQCFATYSGRTTIVTGISRSGGHAAARTSRYATIGSTIAR